MKSFKMKTNSCFSIVEKQEIKLLNFLYFMELLLYNAKHTRAELSGSR